MGAFYGPHHKGTLFKSIDAGSNWLEASSGLPQDDFDPQDDCSCYSTPVGLAIDPGNPATVYVGTYGAGIFKTVDESAHWDPINAGLRAISGSLAIDPQDPRRLYLASRTRIYESSDGGTNWSAGAWGLPGVPLIGLVIDPPPSSTMYAWTG